MRTIVINLELDELEIFYKVFDVEAVETIEELFQKKLQEYMYNLEFENLKGELTFLIKKFPCNIEFSAINFLDYLNCNIDNLEFKQYFRIKFDQILEEEFNQKINVTAFCEIDKYFTYIKI